MQDTLHIISSVIMGLILLCGCRSSLPENSQGDTYIQYYKGGCDGPCDSYKLTIRPNRSASLEPMTKAKSHNQTKRKLSKAVNQQVWEAVAAIDWDSQPAAYPNRQPGAQTIYLIYVSDGKRKEVSYKGMTPPALTPLVKQMEQIRTDGKWKR